MVLRGKQESLIKRYPTTAEANFGLATVPGISSFSLIIQLSPTP